MSERILPKVRLIGQDGNVFGIISKVALTLERHGYVDQAKEFRKRAYACKDYYEVLALVMEFVDVE